MALAATTSVRAGGSGASGPPDTGFSHTCIIGCVASLTPDEQAPVLSVPTTVPELKQRSVWRCHCVRQPPGWGGVDVPAVRGMRYMAADSTAPCAVFT